MSNHKIFQFSSFENKIEERETLKYFINKLGATYDDSKSYSRSATHLIIGDKLDSSEKVLCFIAAGKYILRKSFLQDSFRKHMFLNEQDYHIVKRNGAVKLAKVSLRWYNKIVDNLENMPFLRWHVGCMIQSQEIANALIRIIQSGHGNALLINKETLVSQKNKLTLLIYDDHTKKTAINYSLALQIPCYPYYCIPDYLMNCELSDQPILTINYYESVEKLKVKKNTDNQNSDIILNGVLNEQLDDEVVTCLDESLTEADDFLIKGTYNMYYLSSKQNNCEFRIEDICLNGQFFAQWLNDSYSEALSLLMLLENNELPTAHNLHLLFEFLLEKSPEQKHTFSYDYNTIYNLIYSYVLRLILNHPPINENSIEYFHECFKKLYLNMRIDDRLNNPKGVNDKSTIAKGLIDTIYLITVYDYLLLRHCRASLEKCYCTKIKLDHDITLKNIIRLVRKNQETEFSINSYQKLLQIIYFSNKYLKQTNLFKNCERFMAQNIGVTFSYQNLFASI